jgi:hypothetical protein
MISHADTVSRGFARVSGPKSIAQSLYATRSSHIFETLKTGLQNRRITPAKEEIWDFKSKSAKLGPGVRRF